MDQVSVSASMRFGRRDVFWLSLALLFHVPLFLLPLSETDSAQKTSRILSVILSAQRNAKPVDEPLDGPRADSATIPPATKPESESVPRQAYPKTPPATEADVTAEPAPRRIESAAGLAAYAREYRWQLPETDVKRRLGERPPPRDSGRSELWFNPGSNLFEGSTLPERTEVVDRWTEPDGSHNVVINTVSGQTLCGRAPAWDPLNPLMEHVMQFRACGGGGKRTFKMPDRFNRHLVD